MALVMAMFVVLVVYAMVGVTIVDIRYDLGSLRHSAGQGQAHYLARAGVNYALEQLEGSSGATWQSRHTVTDPDFDPQIIPPQAERVALLAPAEVYAWVQATEQDSVFIVRGAARQERQLEFANLSTWKRVRSEGAAYGLQATGPGQPDSLYRYADGRWEVLPPPPSMFWRNGNPEVRLLDGKPDFSDVVLYPTGDLNGNLYVIGFNGAAGPALYRYDQGLDRWQLLPAPPGLDGIREVDFRGLTVGGTSVFLAAKDGILRLQHPERAAWTLEEDGTWTAGEGEWQEVPSPPLAYFDGQGNLRRSDITTRTMGLAADGHDHLYARVPIPLMADTMSRYDPATGRWDVLPPPPARGYKKQGQTWTLVTFDVAPNNLTVPAVDDRGNLFTVWQPPRDLQSPATAFKFTPDGNLSGGILHGTWKVLPPAELRRHTRDGDLITNPALVAPSQDSLAVDGDGRLLTKYTRGLAYGISEIDTIYSYDSFQRERVTDILPPIPRQRIVVDSSQPQNYRVQDMDGFVEFLPFIGAGGKADSSAAIQYVPIAWY